MAESNWILIFQQTINKLLINPEGVVNSNAYNDQKTFVIFVILKSVPVQAVTTLRTCKHMCGCLCACACASLGYTSGEFIFSDQLLTLQGSQHVVKKTSYERQLLKMATLLWYFELPIYIGSFPNQQNKCHNFLCQYCNPYFAYWLEQSQDNPCKRFCL